MNKHGHTLPGTQSPTLTVINHISLRQAFGGGTVLDGYVDCYDFVVIFFIFIFFIFFWIGVYVLFISFYLFQPNLHYIYSQKSYFQSIHRNEILNKTKNKFENQLFRNSKIKNQKIKI